MNTSPKKKSPTPQSTIPTASLNPALRTTLIVVLILAALYCAIAATVVSCMFMILFPAFANLFAVNSLAALISFATFAYPAVIYSILCALNCIFIKRLIKKQPLSQTQLITYAVLIAFQIILIKFLPTFFGLVSSVIGS